MLPTYVFEEMRLPAELLAASLVFLLPFGKRRSHFPLRAVLGFLFMLGFSLLFFPIFLDKEAPRWYFLSALWYFLIALSAAGYGKLCFQIGWCDALFLGNAAFALQNIVYCFYHCFVARLLFPQLRLLLPLYVLGAALVTALLYTPVWFLFAPPLRQTEGRLFQDTRSLRALYSGILVAMLITLFFYQQTFEERISSFDAMAWFSGIMVCVFVLTIQYSLIRGVVSSRQNAILEHMLRNSEHYYELAKEHIAIINRKCHDLKHQLKALETAGESERAAYIQEAQNSVDFYQHLVYTDNEALNTILAEKGLFCQEKHIDFQCAVDDVDLSFLPLSDLYAILGNALDNAIEYVQTQQEPNMRAISLRITKSNQFAGIQVTNPYAGPALSSAVLPKSHKGDSFNHGFGLKSIRYLAEKYGGTMEFSAADGLFTLQIIFPCSSPAKSQS